MPRSGRPHHLVLRFTSLKNSLSSTFVVRISVVRAGVAQDTGFEYGDRFRVALLVELDELRRVGARAKEHLYDAIGDGLREVTPRDILGWFRHAGQCVMQA